MKKFITLASAYFGRVGFYFLLTISLFAIIASATGSATVNLVLIWSALLFAALIGLADGVFKLKFLGSYPVKLMIHIVLSTLSFALSFVLISGVIESGKSKVWSIFLFLIFASLVGVVRGIFYAIMKKKQNADQSYDYLYTPKN